MINDSPHTTTNTKYWEYSKIVGSRLIMRSPVAMISVVFGSRVNDWTRLHTDLLEKVPHLLVDVLLQEKSTNIKIVLKAAIIAYV